MKKAVLQIETLQCPSCLQKIKKALESEPGVAKTNVFFNTNKAVVTFDEKKTTLAQLQTAVEDLGYKVLHMKTDK